MPVRQNLVRGLAAAAIVAAPVAGGVATATPAHAAAPASVSVKSASNIGLQHTYAHPSADYKSAAQCNYYRNGYINRVKHAFLGKLDSAPGCRYYTYTGWTYLFVEYNAPFRLMKSDLDYWQFKARYHM